LYSLPDRRHYEIPFVEAETDHGLAFALGMVHAHLRLGQIRLLKQVYQGRLSEMAGPAAHDADYALRIVDVGRAAPEIVRRLSPARAMLDAVLAGLNYSQAHMKVRPPEFALLGLDPEPFTGEDLVAIGRLGGAADAYNDWHEFIDARTLPYAQNPPEGFLVSANNRHADTPYPISYFYSADERARRMQDLLSVRDKVSIEDLKALQRDTLLHSQETSGGLVRLIETVPEARDVDPAFFAALKAFDGDYRVDSRGPVVFETLLYHLVPATYGANSPEDLPDPDQDLRQLRTFLVADITALEPNAKRNLLVNAIKAAAADAAKFHTWGDMHRLRIPHWFANLPIVGHYFVYGDYPTGGSRETLMKTAHGLTSKVEPASYGSQARFVSDMGDPDSSEFALMGGNDGWLGSENALDQMPLWRNGRYIKMPLKPATVAREFPIVTQLNPN
jgi:acyl-homoserine lactone acylase PvdQ